MIDEIYDDEDEYEDYELEEEITECILGSFTFYKGHIEPYLDYVKHFTKYYYVKGYKIANIIDKVITKKKRTFWTIIQNYVW